MGDVCFSALFDNFVLTQSPKCASLFVHLFSRHYVGIDDSSSDGAPRGLHRWGRVLVAIVILFWSGVAFFQQGPEQKESINALPKAIQQQFGGTCSLLGAMTCSLGWLSLGCQSNLP